ncbi:MAG TPA: phosphate ABC transporter substrate-binding protein PstS [Cyanobacteria bacterium UBA11149]|nr:phosphate ABC transporter substrate-binding protein PstS [Cyanobacteria bacterium UBA11367]HBE58569.1 phosphate ABC transporter substrate-binding protein PstS [Cyanobacteria bacterium UBA11366]HBK65246.1 phosphate ABC transporter substrate-binding protein PstS [Cyanobacteria bacterium UBA11166]HBR76495.1 phosphate ABC transporter substrate-binding protein PstS [Cyanobacteria bacterium UBA11159]HBS67865.1 phosphate ABC transporter substrate-binding protein PstS [Cyanobacteria bacterium UBA111
MILKNKTLRQALMASIITFAIALSSLKALPAQPLVGAGAVLANNLYQRYISAYQQETGNEVRYDSMDGRKALDKFVEGAVDFAISDLPPTREEVSQIQQKEGMFILPIAGLPIAVIYNLREESAPVSLSRENLVKIFTGKVSSWNQVDPNLPTTDIKVVVRSDRSSANYTLTNYLSAITNGKIETKLFPDWGFDVFSSVTDASRVTGEVRRTDGAIGYVGAIMARGSSLPIAKIQNKSGEYLLPGLPNVIKALNNHRFNEDFTLSSEESPEGYPLTTPIFILLRKQYSSPEKAQDIKEMIDWILTKGQELNQEVQLARIPEETAQRAIQVAKTNISASQ